MPDEHPLGVVPLHVSGIVVVGVYFAIRRANRANGLRGRKFRVANREAVSELKSMTDTELMEQIIKAPEFEKDDEGNDGVDYDLFN